MTANTITYSLQVNGETEQVTGPPQETLLDVLRQRLFLTGAKKGCEQGVCGTCTVLIDGEPRRGCLTLAADCTDREIVTIEGLAEGGKLTPVQAAFVETGAIQCGFCTPGMILLLTAFLRDNPQASAHEIRDCVASNLCRCSGYTKIIQAAGRVTRSSP
jgi:carbon-monoxide dehydrogenase small subunit